MNNNDFLEALSRICNDPEFDNKFNNKNRKRKNKIKAEILCASAKEYVISAIILIFCCIMVVTIMSMSIKNGNTEKSEKNEVVDNHNILTKMILEDDDINTLSPIDVDLFMRGVPQHQLPLTTSSRYPQILSDFNSRFKIECFKKIEDRKMAVIYKLELEDNNIFAVVVFENTHDYYTDNIIIDSDACDFWLYTGECYFYSPELTILFNEKLEENSSFKDFAKEYSGIEHVFTRYINPESGLIIWTTKILTEKGVQQIIYGLKTTLKYTIGNIEIGDSELIKVITIDGV